MEQVSSAVMPSVPYWHLVFMPADSVWWHKYLKPGYAHCWAFGFSPGAGAEAGRWIVFDPAFDGLDVRVAGEEEVVEFFAAAARGLVTILRLQAQGRMVVRPRLVVTCAGALAALVGLRETPLTPWRLACIARRHGAAEVNGG